MNRMLADIDNLSDSRPILLVIDDDPFFCGQVGYFAHKQHQVVKSLEIELVDTESLLRAEVVVLDLKMPGIDGLEFIKTLASLSPQPQLLIASSCDRRVIELARQTAELCGLSNIAVLQKPITKDEFDTALGRLSALCPVRRSRVSSQGLVQSSEADIVRGMMAGEFHVYYQPQIDQQLTKVMGIEALARWHHPRTGVTAPDRFIPTVEQSATALKFTLMILETAMRDYKRLQLTTGYSGTVSVNVPSAVLVLDQFVGLVLKLASSQEFSLDKLVVEISENGLDALGSETVTALARLRMHQIQLSVDDFGTGQSGFSHLKSGAFDELKVDRSFLNELSKSKYSRLIVESILTMGAQAGLRVVAKGVESDNALAWLLQLGSPVVQGYFFSEPLPFNRLSEWITEWETQRPRNIVSDN